MGQFKTIPCPTYPEIRLALGAEEEIRERLRAFEPEAVHISTEGPMARHSATVRVRVRTTPFIWGSQASVASTMRIKSLSSPFPKGDRINA